MQAGAASGGLPRQRGPPTSMLRGDTGKVCAFAQNGRHRAHCIRRVHMRLRTRWTPECSSSACVSEPERSSGDSAGNADNGASLVPLRLGMNWGELLARPRRFWRITRSPPDRDQILESGATGVRGAGAVDHSRSMYPSSSPFRTDQSTSPCIVPTSSFC